MPYVVEVTLPTGRKQLGQLIIRDPITGLVGFGPIPCCGKAANNTAPPGRDPRQCNGDTPTGEYAVTGVIPAATTGEDLDRFGPNPRLALTGKLGEALIRQNAITASANPREELRIHGGRQAPIPQVLPPPPAGVQGLMVTHGCLRVFDQDMSAFLAYLANQHAPFPMAMVVTEVPAVAGAKVVIEDATDPTV